MARSRTANKKLSGLESAELLTIHRDEPNRFLTPRVEHLVRRGLVELDARGTPRVTTESYAAMRRFGMALDEKD